MLSYLNCIVFLCSKKSLCSRFKCNLKKKKVEYSEKKKSKCCVKKNWEQIYRNSGAIQAVCVDHLIFHLVFYPGDPITVVCLGTGLEICRRDWAAFLRELLWLVPGQRQEWHQYCLSLGVLAILFSFLLEKMEWKSHLRWWLTAHELLALWRSFFLGFDCERNRQGTAQQLQHKTGSVKPPQKCLICCSPDPWNDIIDLFHNNTLILNIFWCIH